jgi:hypothetical protein
VVTKKKYKLKDNLNSSASMSTISINSSILNESIVSLPQTIAAPKNEMEVHDLSSYIKESDVPTKTYKFEYNFNEYLRLFLIKVLPLKEKNMIILFE